MIDWSWVSDHLDELAFRTLQHLYLAAIAVVVGFAISLALGLVAVRHRTFNLVATAFAGLVFTIPSLALFAALVGPLGLSVLTAEIPLVLYTLVILLRNVVAGLQAAPAEVREAADGMGFRTAGKLWSVELPLAAPLMIAGLRIATVSTIGLVTITAVLGQALGGLGFFIYEGMNRYFATEILVGAIPTILLSLLADRGFVWLQAWVTPWAQQRRLPVETTA
jgi:osmoprotectant transport system permease protein